MFCLSCLYENLVYNAYCLWLIDLILLKNEYQSCIARLVNFDIAILRCPENGDVAIVRVICNCRELYF